MIALIRRLAAWAADDDQGMLAAVTAPAPAKPKLAAAPVDDVDELPHLAAAMAEANARSVAEWSARRAGLCLACNGKQHDACEGADAPGGPCQCHDPFHVFGSDSTAPLRVGEAVDVPGTHRSCREAAARVCACCAPLLAIDQPTSRAYITHQETAR